MTVFIWIQTEIKIISLTFFKDKGSRRETAAFTATSKGLEEQEDMKNGTFLAKPDETIEEHVNKLLIELERMKNYGYIQDNELCRMIRLACIHHDDGKMNPEMQRRLEKAKCGYHVMFNPDKEIPHNVLSGFFLNPTEFDGFENPKLAYYRVLFAILYHHDYGNPIEIMEENKDLIVSLLDGFCINDINKPSIRTSIPEMAADPVAIKIKGFLHLCDYSASGGYISEYPNDFLDSSMENVRTMWRQHDPEADWNELQNFCGERQDENVIVVAQTGMGKTEAGFRWIGNHKGYFILPLRTAINAMYDRVKETILLNKDIDTRLAVLHSESLEYYSKQSEGNIDLLEYESRGKHLSIPLSISTLDQLFDFVFKYQTYELKLTTLSFSKIVIDEIQMYDPELLRYLITGLKQIVSMGGRVAVMTATLPPFIKDLLMENIPFKKENIATFVNDSIRHHLEIRDRKINAEEIEGFYRRNCGSGEAGKILVVCNTIRKAQELYEELKENLGDQDVHILHSRFIRRERAVLEKEILDFGKTFDENRKVDRRSGIWISTSLVEASLDIDFDYLFTELYELSSLFQRLGRCNRKGVKSIEEPNCFVYTQIDAEHLTGTLHGFIDRTLFELSRSALNEVKGILSEAQKIELINKYFTTENVRGSEYLKKYEKIEWIEGIQPYQFEKNDVDLRNILSETVIPSPIYEKHRQEIESAAEKAADMTRNYMDRLKEKEKIMQYTLSVPYWYWTKYQSAVRQGKACSFAPVKLSRREQIPVMECVYDEAGFHQMNFQDPTGMGIIL